MNSANLFATLSKSKDDGFFGIGPATAKKLLKDYGGVFETDELLRHLRDRNEDAFRNIKGIDEKKINGLMRGANVLSAKLDLADYLDSLGLKRNAVDKLYNIWGKKAKQKIKRNPYLLLCVMDWEPIDSIGRSLGPPDHPCRLIGAVEWCMYKDYEGNNDSGVPHTCIPPSLLLEEVKGLLNCSDDVAGRAVELALEVKAILKHGDVLQTPAAFSFERQTEHFLKNNREYDISESKIRSYLRNSEFGTLNPEQEKAVINALQNHISVFYGRGGRGKTFVLKALSSAASDAKLMGSSNKVLEPLLCAVSAQACQRIKHATGIEAVTVARILYVFHKSELANKIVMVDEASMLSLSDAYHLIKKIPDSSRLVLLGDPGQIPSVDAGRVLYDVIESGVVPRVELVKNLRQDEKTDNQLAEILAGRFPVLDDYRAGAGSGLYRSVVKDVFAAEKKAMELHGLFGEGSQIISPLRNYEGGVDSINEMIHSDYYHRTGFCPGTPVVFTKRNMFLKTKRSGVAPYLTNGSKGTVVKFLTTSPRYETPYLVVDFEFNGTVTLTWDETEKYLQEAYCLTCHQSQGSEWDTVIIVLPKNRLVDRNMVYTALSRCRDKAILIYDDHKYVAGRVKDDPAYLLRRSALFGV